MWFEQYLVKTSLSSIQQGLATGVNEHFVIGKYEAGIQLAQRAIDDAA